MESTDKRDRLAAALRANLRRRKQARRAPDASVPEEAGIAPDEPAAGPDDQRH